MQTFKLHTDHIKTNGALLYTTVIAVQLQEYLSAVDHSL